MVDWAERHLVRWAAGEYAAGRQENAPPRPVHRPRRLAIRELGPPGTSWRAPTRRPDGDLLKIVEEMAQAALAAGLADPMVDMVAAGIPPQVAIDLHHAGPAGTQP